MTEQRVQWKFAIEPEWESGQMVFAVYAWKGDGARRKVESFTSFELAHQRYPDARRTHSSDLIRRRSRAQHP